MANRSRLILASASSGRRWLMSRTYADFDVIASSVEEPEIGFSNPKVMVHTIAWMKAFSVAQNQVDSVIIAADTITWIDGRPLLKPKDREHARYMISILQGRIHELWTGVVVWNSSTNIQTCWQERSLVRVAPMCENQIDRYLNERTWDGCSGGYAIEGESDPIIQVVDGSISNIIGLPMESLGEILGAIR